MDALQSAVQENLLAHRVQELMAHAFLAADSTRSITAGYLRHSTAYVGPTNHPKQRLLASARSPRPVTYFARQLTRTRVSAETISR